jgi:hypothetical protein
VGCGGLDVLGLGHHGALVRQLVRLCGSAVLYWGWGIMVL